MRVLYLGGPGPTNIRLTRDGLIIGEEKAIPPPEFDFDTILVGNTKGFASFPALKCLGKWGVTVALMGRYGTPLSTFVPWARNDAPLRLAQMRCALDERLRAKVARALVEAKTGWKLPAKLRTADDIRNEEGRLDYARWKFFGIDRRSGFYKNYNAKATRPICAALNYAQGVHAVKCRTIIAKVGLDDSVGFLHRPSRDKEGFGYDVQELARFYVDEAALRFYREVGDAAFIRDDDWVYRLRLEPAKELSLRVCAALEKQVRYQGEKVPIEGVITKEIRRLGEWFRNPASDLELFSLMGNSEQLCPQA